MIREVSRSPELCWCYCWQVGDVVAIWGAEVVIYTGEVLQSQYRQDKQWIYTWYKEKQYWDSIIKLQTILPYFNMFLYVYFCKCLVQLEISITNKCFLCDLYLRGSGGIEQKYSAPPPWSPLRSKGRKRLSWFPGCQRCLLQLQVFDELWNFNTLGRCQGIHLYFSSAALILHSSRQLE